MWPPAFEPLRIISFYGETVKPENETRMAWTLWGGEGLQEPVLPGLFTSEAGGEEGFIDGL